MDEAQARVVRVVDVVDREEQAVRRRREANELGDRDEQSLVGAASRPGHLGAAEGSVDLLPMHVGEAVEQRRMLPAHVRECLDDRCIRPRSLDRRRGAVSHAKAHLSGAVRDRLDQHALADTRDAVHDHRAPSAGCSLEQRPFGDGELDVAADEVVLVHRHDVVLPEEPISQRDRVASRRHAELPAQRAIHPLELP